MFHRLKMVPLIQNFILFFNILLGGWGIAATPGSSDFWGWGGERQRYVMLGSNQGQSHARQMT